MKKKAILVVSGVIVLIIAGIITFFATASMRTYNKALNLMEERDYEAAIELFLENKDYKDSLDKLNECYYSIGLTQLDNHEYVSAKETFSRVKDYKDSADKIKECQYQEAKLYIGRKEYDSAIVKLNELNYKDSNTLISMCKYEIGKQFFFSGDFDKASIYLKNLDYEDSKLMCAQIEKKVRAYNNKFTFTIAGFKTLFDRLSLTGWTLQEESNSGNNNTLNCVNYVAKAANGKYEFSIRVDGEKGKGTSAQADTIIVTWTFPSTSFDDRNTAYYFELCAAIARICEPSLEYFDAMEIVLNTYESSINKRDDITYSYLKFSVGVTFSAMPLTQ